MSIYQIWIPGETDYKEHLDRLQFSNDNINAFKEFIHQLILPKQKILLLQTNKSSHQLTKVSTELLK